jgi:hypothetical protein
LQAGVPCVCSLRLSSSNSSAPARLVCPIEAGVLYPRLLGFDSGKARDSQLAAFVTGHDFSRAKKLRRRRHLAAGRPSLGPPVARPARGGASISDQLPRPRRDRRRSQEQPARQRPPVDPWRSASGDRPRRQAQPAASRVPTSARLWQMGEAKNPNHPLPQQGTTSAMPKIRAETAPNQPRGLAGVEKAPSAATPSPSIEPEASPPTAS